jgi:lysophospholipase L1-like esterase
MVVDDQHAHDDPIVAPTRSGTPLNLMPGNAEPKLVVTALGDSITSGAPLWDPDPSVRERAAATDERSQWMYWAHLEHPHLVFRNHGVNTQETSEIAERLEAAVQGADALVIQGGVNDLVHGKSGDRALANLDSMVLRGLELGLRVAIAELIPNDNFEEILPGIARMNGGLRAIAADRGVPLLRFHAALDDPDRPGHIRPGCTDDGNHPNVHGHRRVGELGFQLPDSWRPE